MRLLSLLGHFYLYRAPGRGNRQVRGLPEQLQPDQVPVCGSGRLAKLDAVRILDEQQRRFLEPLTIAERRVLAGLLRRLHEGPASGPT